MLTRRKTLAVGAAGIAATMVPASAFASAVDDAISNFTGGATLGDGGITLITPEIAENGNTVPVSVEAPDAQEIVIIATGNPTPGVAKFTFGEASGTHMASTRIRLGGTQDVVAIAKLADGSFVQASAEVKVTIGGCGG